MLRLATRGRKFHGVTPVFVLFTSEPRVIFIHVVHCYRRCCNVLVWFFEVLWYFVVKFGRARGFVAKQTKETKMKLRGNMFGNG